MTDKRFTMIYFETDGNLIFDETKHDGEWYNSAECLQDDEIVNLLNDLHEEKEDWKDNCLKSVSENSILWNEISILREQGAEPSDAFKNYLNGLKSKNNKLQGDFE